MAQVARRYIGQTEITPNRGFTDHVFATRMKNAGWKPGDAWCMYFVRMVAIEAAPNATWFHALLTSHSQITLANCMASDRVVVSQTPRVGDIVIYQYVKNGIAENRGHGGIVSRVGADSFYSIEGNTNEAGSSEGTTVLEKMRTYAWSETTGLRLRGFIRPK